jgi:hypothetical protein
VDDNRLIFFQKIQKPDTIFHNYVQGVIDYVNDEEEMCAVLVGSDEVLATLENSDFMLTDATFSVVPSQFAQVLNVMVDYKGTVIPVLHVLMTSKKKELYTKVFSEIKSRFPQFVPKTTMSDFESAITKSLQDVFPEVQICGCRFHYSKANHKNFTGTKYRCHDEYHKNPIIQKWFRKLMSLSLLPAGKIRAEYSKLKAEAGVFENEESRQKCLNFCNSYFER